LLKTFTSTRHPRLGDSPYRGTTLSRHHRVKRPVPFIWPSLISMKAEPTLMGTSRVGNSSQRLPPTKSRDRIPTAARCSARARRGAPSAAGIIAGQTRKLGKLSQTEAAASSADGIWTAASRPAQQPPHRGAADTRRRVRPIHPRATPADELALRGAHRAGVPEQHRDAGGRGRELPM